MAKFELEIPKEILDQMNTIYNKCDEIFGGITKAGAEVVVKNVKAKAPLPEIANSVKTSVVYKTPSDGAINTKVYFSGYIPFKGNRMTFSRYAHGERYETDKGVPIPFLVNMYEYGRKSSPFPKRPFFRSSFKAKEIEKAMLEAQTKLSGGIIK